VESLLQKIKDTCEMEIAVSEDESPEEMTDGSGDIFRGRIEFAEGVLRMMKHYKEDERQLSFDFTIDTTDADERRLAEKDLQDEFSKMPNVQNS